MTWCMQYLNTGKRHQKGECCWCDKEEYGIRPSEPIIRSRKIIKDGFSPYWIIVIILIFILLILRCFQC